MGLPTVVKSEVLADRSASLADARRYTSSYLMLRHGKLSEYSVKGVGAGRASVRFWQCRFALSDDEIVKMECGGMDPR